MKHLKLFENNENKITVQDLESYGKISSKINKVAKDYVDLYGDIDFDWFISDVCVGNGWVTIEVEDVDYDGTFENVELSIEDFANFYNNPEMFKQSKKYNL